MRKLIASCLAVLPLAVLTACGNSQNTARTYATYSIECVKAGGYPELSKPDGNNGAVYFICKNGDNK